ncbi:hypothetical protein L1887_09647 [Cichorium endivia]|nr:hypothetical protein L1887_09647 [Cichorium endivia]
MNTAYQKNWLLYLSTENTILIWKYIFMYEHRLIDDMVAYALKVMEGMFGHANIMMVMFKVISWHKELIQVNLCNMRASEVLASVIYDSTQQEVVPTSPKHHPWIMVATFMGVEATTMLTPGQKRVIRDFKRLQQPIVDFFA